MDLRKQVRSLRARFQSLVKEAVAIGAVMPETILSEISGLEQSGGNSWRNNPAQAILIYEKALCYASSAIAERKKKPAVVSVEHLAPAPVPQVAAIPPVLKPVAAPPTIAPPPISVAVQSPRPKAPPSPRIIMPGMPRPVSQVQSCGRSSEIRQPETDEIEIDGEYVEDILSGPIKFLEHCYQLAL